MTAKSDLEYQQEICDGNKVSFDFIFRKYYYTLRNYAFRLLKEDAPADDIIQEVFFQLWKKRDQLSHVKKLSSYLLSMVHNQCISHIRKASKNNFTLLDDDGLRELPGLYADIIQYHKSFTISGDLNSRLNSAIESLPNQCKTVFTLSRKFGLRNKEIAEFLNVSVKAVEKHISRALGQLREDLKEFLPMVLAFFFLTK